MLTEEECVLRLERTGVVLRTDRGYAIQINSVDESARADELCQWIAQLPGVFKVDSTGCAITSDGIRSLATMEGLEELRVAGAHPPDGVYKSMAGMQSLRRLTCSVAISNEGLGYIAQLVNLSALCLRCCRQITDGGLGHLIALQQLIELDLGATGVTQNLSPINQLPRLEKLLLEGTAVDDSAFTSISGMPQIQSLYLGRTRITDRSVATLGRFPRLTTLGIGETGITNRGLTMLSQQVPQLTCLHVSGIELDDQGVQAIGAMKSLKDVFAIDTKITKHQRKTLKGRLPHCDVTA